jgi:polyketide synthase PksN
VATKAMLPFALDCLEIFPEAATARIAWIRESAGSSDRLRKIDIDIVDDSGRVGVRIVGYAARVIEEALGNNSQAIATRLFEPTWSEAQVGGAGDQVTETRWVILCPSPVRRDLDSLKRQYDELLSREENTTNFSWIETTGSVAECYGQTVVAVIATLQEIVKSKLSDEVLVQIVVEDEALSGLSGLVQTARLENPNLLVQLVEVEGLGNSEQVLGRLRDCAVRSDEIVVRYRDEKREVRQWREVALAGESRSALPAMPWRDQGIYLITGGAGGLGLIFAGEIARRVKTPTLILTGRSPLSEKIKGYLTDFEKNGARARYFQVDVSDAQAVSRLIGEVKKEYGTLHGILHCAGALRDSFLINKSPAQIQAVLAAKVAGTMSLDEATAGLPLDFMVLFSAVAGAIGNVGQSDYAAGNAFMDGFAARRNQEVRNGKRQGRTLSLDWPLWEHGGMQIDPSARSAMSEAVGVMAMPTDVGIQALYDSWATKKDQVMVLHGDRRVYGLLHAPVMKKSRVSAKELHLSAADAIKLEERAIRFLKTQVASVVKLPAERLNADDAMEKFGIDSVMVLQLTNTLERSFGSLSKTLFFEYQTMRELVGYFMHSHPERLTALLKTA